jgi:hypothetical protein
MEYKSTEKIQENIIENIITNLENDLNYLINGIKSIEINFTKCKSEKDDLLISNN